MTLQELLDALGAAKASDVMIGRLPNAGSADPRAASKAADTRAAAMDRGECIAECGGKGRVVSADQRCRRECVCVCQRARERKDRR